KRAGSPLAFSTKVVTCGRRQSMTRSSSVRPASSRRHLSPPPMRRDCPPASSRPTIFTAVPSLRVLFAARLARKPLRPVSDGARVAVKHDALGTGKRDEAFALGPADERKSGLPRQFDPPGGKAGTRNQDRDAHLHRFDDHFRGQTTGCVKCL